MGGNWLVGVLLSVCGAFAGASGKVYMKHYHNTKLRRHFSLALFFSVLLDPALTMASALFAPQSIIAPIVALDIVWNTVLASSVLKERVTTPDYITVFMLMGGCALATAGGPRETPDYSREELKGLFSDQPFIIYMTILGLWMSVLYMAAFGMMRFFIAGSEDHDVRGGSHPLLVKVHRFSFGALAGTIGGNLYFLKAGMESLKQGIAVFSHYESYIFLVGALVSLFLGLYHLNQGLRLYDAVTVGCTTEACLILNGSFSGLIIFREFDEISGSPGRLVMYFGGLLVCLIGIVILANRPPPSTAGSSSSSSSSPPTSSSPPSPPPPSFSSPLFSSCSSSSSSSTTARRRSSVVAEQGRGGVEGGSEEGTMTRLSESLVSVHRQEV